MTPIIGESVKVKCPVYKNGRTFYGKVTGIKKGTSIYTTVYVLIDGNKKSTSFSTDWITQINPLVTN